MPLEGKVCIVTGASSGIGETIAVFLAQRKASVILCGRSEERVENVFNQCVDASPGKSRHKFLNVLGDVTHATVRNSIVDKTVSKFGKIDVLICNAGQVTDFVGILDMKEQNYDSVMNVNVKSVFFLIQKVTPYLEKTKGTIVTISSILSHDANPLTAYSISKAAIDQLTRCCAAQFAKKSIRVNSVNPTCVAGTRVWRCLLPEGSKDDEVRKKTDAVISGAAKLHPLGKRVATPVDVANAVMFLVSDESCFITGQSIDVDGGILTKSRTFPDN